MFKERKQQCEFQAYGEESHGVSGEGILAKALGRSGYKSRFLYLLASDLGQMTNLFETQFSHLKNGNDNSS